MSRLRALGRFAYDFVIGDDPVIAGIVVLALALTGELSSRGLSPWWLLPLAVAGVLGLSVRRAARGPAPGRPLADDQR